jgi:prephenate dehydrogenase
MNVAIVGLGLIGGSAALDLKSSGFATSVTGVDANKDHTEEALRLKLVDRVAPLDEAISSAEVVILAIPVGAIRSVLSDVLTKIAPKTSVTDMGSTKETICKAVAQHPRRSQYVASHPMAGTEFSGPQAAIRNLFSEKAAVICDKNMSAPEHLTRIETMYQALNMRLIYMGAAEHDLHAAYVSHLSHISSFVLANTILAKEKDVNTIFDLASGGFESTVRLAKSSPLMWTPIFEENQEQVVNALSAYIDHLKDFHESLVSKNFGKTRSLMERANEIRRVLSRFVGQGKK